MALQMKPPHCCDATTASVSLPRSSLTRFSSSHCNVTFLQLPPNNVVKKSGKNLISYAVPKGKNVTRSSKQSDDDGSNNNSGSYIIRPRREPLREVRGFGNASSSGYGDNSTKRRLKHWPCLTKRITDKITTRDIDVGWDDVAGLNHAKNCLTELVIWPLLRPEMFKGCRSPARGLLLFGPRGTGKTMIGKAIAGEAKATFFYMSASKLTCEWIGESVKLVRALFEVARSRQPAVIFVDEIDTLLSQRNFHNKLELSRRLKSQFFIEMEGLVTGNEQVLLIGATNRPQDLHEAARRRFTKRLYIPLPCSEARAWIIRNTLEKDGLFTLSTEDINTISKLTEGYSGSDMKNLVKNASMIPMFEVFRQGTEITKLETENFRPITLQDFENSMQEVRSSVSLDELGAYEDWNNQFGSLSL